MKICLIIIKVFYLLMEANSFLSLLLTSMEFFYVVYKLIYLIYLSIMSLSYFGKPGPWSGFLKVVLCTTTLIFLVP